MELKRKKKLQRKNKAECELCVENRERLIFGKTKMCEFLLAQKDVENFEFS